MNGSTQSINPETFETNLEGIFLAGVVCGGMETSKWFIENSRDHAQFIFNRINELSAESISE
jgi:thioredoxin reductase (NADPH)